MNYAPPKSTDGEVRGTEKPGLRAAKFCAPILILNSIVFFAQASLLGTVAGVAGIVVAAALLRWPQKVRWLLVGLGPTVGIAALLLLPHFFGSVPNYSFFWSGALQGLGYAVLLFGAFNPVRLAASTPFFAASMWLMSNPTEGSPLSAEQCSVRVNLVAERLEPFRTHDEIVHDPDEPGIPELAIVQNLAPSHTRRALLEIHQDRIVFGPRPLTKHPDDLAKEFAVFKKLDAASKAPVRAVNVFLDKGLRVSEAEPYLDVLSDVRVFAVVRWGSPFDPAKAPEGAQEISEVFEEKDPVVRQGRVMNLLAKYASPCKGLGERYNELNTAKGQRFYDVLIDGTVEGLRECECGWVNIDHIEFLVARYMSGGQRPYAEIEIPRASDGALLLPEDRQQLVGDWLQRVADAALGSR